MMDVLEIIGTVIGLLYLYLEYKASIYLWIAGILMPLVYIFVYYDSGFYADMGINVYYLGASVYGWLMWVGRSRRSSDGEGGEKVSSPIGRMPRKYWWPMAGVSAVLLLFIAWILINFTDSDVAWGDSFTTALSVVAMWMLARKYVEQWLLWIAVDVVCVVLYLYKGLYPTAILYALYSVIAVAGYFKWLKLMKQQ